MCKQHYIYIAIQPERRSQNTRLSMSKHTASLTNHNAAAYNQNAAFVYSAKYTAAVLDLLDARPGERIADLGCGTGELTLQIADTVGERGSVVGLDSSADMVSAHSHVRQRVGADGSSPKPKPTLAAGSSTSKPISSSSLRRSTQP